MYERGRGIDYHILQVTPFQQNCTLIWCQNTRRAAILDPGGDVELISRKINKLDLIPERILVTHGHIDHCGGAAALAESLSIPVEGPQQNDAFWLEAMGQQAEMYGFGDVGALQPERWLDHGDLVAVGDQQLEVIHCPGHTPGHVVFFHRPSQLAFVGDVLFRRSIGRTDFPGGNQQDLVDSIRQRLFPLGDTVQFIPGHGVGSTFGEERACNPFVGDSS